MKVFAFIVFQGSKSLSGKRENRYHIKDGHKGYAQVSQFPDNFIGSNTAHKEHNKSKNLIAGLCRPSIAKHKGYVASGIEKDAGNIGKTEARK